MKKVIAFCLAVIMTGGLVNKVQAQAYEEGSSVVQVGVGLGSSLGLPIGIAYEYGLKETISLGGYVGYASKTTNFGFYDATFSYVVVGLRGSYHFEVSSDKLDPYVGALIGYNAASVSVSNSAFSNAVVAGGGLAYGGHVGARYYLTDNLAGFGELGYGLGYLTLGIAYKL